MSSKIPETWSNSNQTLVEVHPFDDQYWQVVHRLKETMPDAHISKLWRVQNKKLWKFYCLHKEKLATNGICANESSVWHGTKTLDPSVIYSDRQDGFMMQYAKKGYWGCGIYFADDSVYSNTYSHRPINGADDRPTGQSDEHELIYTKLLKGNHVVLDACRELIVPPEDPISGLKYSTVAGRTQGYNVWIVYENGRAYPDYIVRYYGGTRDPKRTPYSSQKEAAARGGVCVAWEFSADSAWTTFSLKNHQILEFAYISFCTKSGPSACSVSNEDAMATYIVMFSDLTMSQTNTNFRPGKQFSVRRSIGHDRAALSVV